MTRSMMRIAAMILRYTYLLRSSWPRILELAYWPTVQMIMWGLITKFFMGHSTLVAQASGLLISAVLLWDVLFRSQLGVTLPFYEELYSRNLGHLFVSPLKPYELVLSLIGISVIRTLVGIIPAALLAIPLYHYSIFDLGLPLIAFFMNLLVMGWAMGIIIAGLVLKYGLGAESLAWVAVFAIAPISGIYYPIEILPGWAQGIAVALPSSHVFEGMRSVLLDNSFSTYHFLMAAGLNVVYIIIAMLIFLRIFQVARIQGLLLNIGE